MSILGGAYLQTICNFLIVFRNHLRNIMVLLMGKVFNVFCRTTVQQCGIIGKNVTNVKYFFGFVPQ